MEAMRVGDARLVNETYMDKSMLQVAASIAALPPLSVTVSGESASEGNFAPHSDTDANSGEPTETPENATQTLENAKAQVLSDSGLHRSAAELHRIVRCPEGFNPVDGQGQ